jgi:hypothetical protein
MVEHNLNKKKNEKMKSNQPNTAATGRRRTEIEKENKFPKIK